MDVLDELLERFAGHAEATAIVWKDTSYSYGWLVEEVARLLQKFKKNGQPARGTVVGLDADYSPRSIALLLALMQQGCIVVPITAGFRSKKPEFWPIAQVQSEFRVDGSDDYTVESFHTSVDQPLLQTLRDTGDPGLVIFSSGSSGNSKAAVHDCRRLLAKYKTPRRASRTIPFMLFDHIGGINTMLHVLSSGGTLVAVSDRQPDTVCKAIERHRVQVLPASPTFINLMMMRGCADRYDMSSLEVLAYGAEAMPEHVLRRVHEALPDVELHQNYGMSEVGILRSKSEAADSLWVKLGGDDCQVRVRNGLLELKAHSAMLGYLNAPSPFTDDGWLQTGDLVEVKGEYVRVLGRASDIINVGGEKVYPAEVEAALEEMDGVLESVVSGAPHVISGQIVQATVRLATDETRSDFRRRMAEYLRDKLPDYKIPQKLAVTDQPLVGARLKKVRKAEVRPEN